MFNVLIADDERIVRDGIINHIDWASLDMRVAAEAATGTIALEQIERETSLDVALLDINMPGVNGLDVANALKQKFPNCLIVILTGYDEFEYARSAIRTGVYDYVLKPITKSELTALLSKIKDVLSTRTQQTKAALDSNEKTVLLQNSFYNLIEAKNPEQILSFAKVLAVDLDAANYIFAVLDADNFTEDNAFHKDGLSLFNFALLNVTREILEQRAVAYCDRSGRTTILFFSGQSSAQSSLSQAQQDVEKIQQIIAELLGVSISAGLSNAFSTLDASSNAYEEACYALDFRFSKGAGALIRIDQLTVVNPPTKKFDNSLEQFLSNLNTISQSEAHALISELFKDIAAQSDAKACKNAAARALMLIVKAFGESGVEMKDLAQDPDIIGQVYSAKTLLELEQLTKKLYAEFKSTLIAHSSSSKIVSIQIKEFIKNNYMDSELTLKKLCLGVHFSPSYVSLIFKNEIGKTFVEYLTETRIEKAKELLHNSSYMTYTIAEIVGFSSPHYFSLVFKKTTGVSPKEYREGLEVSGT